MSETKRLVKCALGFILAILMIVGAAFGLDVEVDVNDTDQNSEVVETIDKEQSSVDSTKSEDDVVIVDKSEEA
jgi:hypothetical protein